MNTRIDGFSNTFAANTNSKINGVAVYTKTLSAKYSYFNNKSSVSGIPTTVDVSSAYIRKCSSDPELAQKLEETLDTIPKLVDTAINGCFGTITNLKYSVDPKGELSVEISGSSDPDGKIARENAEKKAKEKNAKKRQNIDDYNAKMRDVIAEQRKRSGNGDTVTAKKLEEIMPDPALEKSYIEKFEAMREKLAKGDFFSSKA